MITMLYLWLFIAAVSVFIELATTTFAALCFAVGGLVAAGLAWLGISLPWQIVGFCIAALVSFAMVRPLVQRYIFHGQEGDKVPTNADALIGRTATVTETIDPTTGQGLIKTDGDVWSARSSHGQAIATGQQVRIVHRDSIVMYVEPIA
ncbi:MAG: NfeD family protein [Bacteroidales bacterium]|nr:NfeD family protein [Bacteroidales bacterium]